MCFAHPPEIDRKFLHEKIIYALKPGGPLNFEVFSKDQINYVSGGPKNEAMLYSTEAVNVEFQALDISYPRKVVIPLDEGLYHQGVASVIQFLAKKKSNFI